MITLYGIPNCNTVKKARQWLSDQGLNYVFHDFKKQGVDTNLLTSWVAAITLEKLINRQGTTWRALSPEQKALAEQESTAISLIQSNPSIIKRPVLDRDGQLSVGFNEAIWAEKFGK